MLNVDLLRGYYTGHGVKVALIDTGISAEVCAQSLDVRTYAYDKKEDRIKETQTPLHTAIMEPPVAK